MEKRVLKISFNKSGAGNITPKLSLPANWIKDMGINLDDREIEVTYVNGEITIKKKQ